MKLFITGAGGYLGTKMVEFFLKNGHKVTVLDRFFFGPVFGNSSNKNLNIIKDDIRSFPGKMLDRMDVCIHLASISNDPASDLDPILTKSINYTGAVRTAKLAKKAGIRQFIFASSCSVYGHSENVASEKSNTAPITTYAKSKIAAEKEIIALASENYSPTILRLATLYGLSRLRMRFDLIVNIMTLHAWQNNKIFILGGGKHWRPLIHLDDCINAFNLVIQKKNRKKVKNQIFNVGSNTQNYQVYQVAYLFKKYFPKLEIETAPDDPDKRTYKVSFDKIRDSLGFTTDKTVEDGISEIKPALEKGEISDDIRTSTFRYYQYLIEADRLLKDVKMGGRLF